MGKSKRSDIKNNYQHFKATIGTISEEVDYFGNHKEVLSLNKIHLGTVNKGKQIVKRESKLQ